MRYCAKQFESDDSLLATIVANWSVPWRERSVAALKGRSLAESGALNPRWTTGLN